jgi:phospholipid/cholesterol/gamma-HCH transport system ATP-binding protein
MSTAEDSPPLIRVDGLTKRFGDRTVIDSLSLTIERGETVVVIGGSGSGKTTFARMLVCLDRPTSGTVFVDGVDLMAQSDAELTRLRRRFAMVFQHHSLLDSLSVFDNVAFPLREETDFDEEEIAARVMRALRELGVEQAAHKLPGQLSGGMAKRVGIARAVVIEPEILVYDEPTSGLDPISSRQVDRLIEHMRETYFVKSVVITHDMVTAYEVADRVLLLAGGKIVADGDPEVVFRSHDDAIRPFAMSSGVDLDKLAPRAARKTVAEIRAGWVASHPKDDGPKPGWFSSWWRALSDR